MVGQYIGEAIQWWGQYIGEAIQWRGNTLVRQYDSHCCQLKDNLEAAAVNYCQTPGNQSDSLAKKTPQPVKKTD